MTVAPRSIREWPASERIASEPVVKPTIALATVNPAEAIIEERATCSFSLCIRRRLAQTATDFDNRLELSYSQSNRPSVVCSRSCDRVENANIGEQLLNRKTVRRPAFNGICPSLEIHSHRVRMLELAALPTSIRSTVYEAR